MRAQIQTNFFGFLHHRHAKYRRSEIHKESSQVKSEYICVLLSACIAR